MMKPRFMGMVLRGIGMKCMIARPDHGAHALDEFDADGDGKITASDPVYNQLKVWLDIQHDGQMQAFETLSLAAAGISELGINSGQFVRNGEANLMTTTALTADSAGTIVHVEGNNLRVLKETGDTLLMVSALADFAKSTDAQVRDSHTRLSANGTLTVVNELMDGLEDTAIVVSVEQLLKNDASSAGTTSISMVGGAFGGTVSLDAAQGTIRFTPSAEFSGEGSFRYVVTDAQGQKTTGKALVHVAGVNDAPVLTNLGATRAAGSADFKTTGSTITMPTGNVPKLESPARLELGVAQANLAGVTVLGATDSQHLVGQKDGQMYVGTLQGNLQTSWQTARVPAGIFGAVAGTDVDSANALNYQKLLDGRYGTVEINANTGLWSYTQNSWPQYVTQDAFVVNAIDEHGGKAELKVVVQLDPLFDPLAPPVVYSDLRYDAAPPPTPVPAVVGAGDQVLHGDGGNNWIYGAAGNDKVYGGDGNDELGGDKGNDELFGEDGDDTLFGEEGADQMTGGAGNDIYYVDDLGDTTTEAASGGTDTVMAGLTWTLASEVEQLTLTGTRAINGTGNAGNNVLQGNAAANMLDGVAGNDVLWGEGGNDKITASDPVYDHYQNSSCLRTTVGRQRTFLYLKTWDQLANQSLWRNVA
jgi:Ca2+-binding RTX toxin-like protein